MIRRAAVRANAIVVPTVAVAEDLARHAPGPATIAVVPHGVPDALLAPVDAEQSRAAAAGLELPDSYVLAVGTVEPRKGLDVLIEAMAKPFAPDLPLVIVGPRGWGEVDLTALAEAHGLAPSRLRVLGRISDPDLAVVLRRASVLAVPSRAEGFGLPVLEALAVGTPVVHTDVPALLEVAGDAGVAVPRDDARTLAATLRAVLDDGPGTRRRVAQGQLRAAAFTWEHAASELWRLHTRFFEMASAR
jgi:glycosyltransferase involved in cell wall biosynthesis